MTRCFASMAKLGLAVIAAALALDCVALGVDIVLGRRIVAGQEVTASNLEASSALSSAANFAIPLAVLIGGLAYLRWFHCAYRRLAASGETKLDPIWAAIGWFVPGINLVRPPQIMTELTSRRTLVTLWWSLWAVGAVIQVALRFINPATQQGWVNWQTVALLANLILLGSVACALTLIDLTRRRLVIVSRPALIRPAF